MPRAGFRRLLELRYLKCLLIIGFYIVVLYKTKTHSKSDDSGKLAEYLQRLFPQYLLHIFNDPNSLQPALKWSKRKTQPEIVLGIPTVKRSNESYLGQTLKSIFDNIDDNDDNDVLVILMIAEPNDFDYVKNTSDRIGLEFRKQLDSGLLEIIAPPRNFYPNFSSVKQTFGDNLERVQWRSKQNLDYAFLMMYAKQWSSTYYVQLEDDILVSLKYYVTMSLIQ